MARARFSGLMHHLTPEQEEDYWGKISIGYEPYYAYEEVLAVFRDRPRQSISTLSSMVTLANYLNGTSLFLAEAMDELRRAEVLARFTVLRVRQTTANGNSYGWAKSMKASACGWFPVRCGPGCRPRW